jgi:hypothetical protein
MAGDVAQVVEDQPSKLKALNINPSTAPQKENYKRETCQMTITVLILTY